MGDLPGLLQLERHDPGGIIMSDNNNNGGIGFLGLLTILFIGLKLTGYITWSWWWVLAPIWIPVLIFVVIVIIGYLIKEVL